MVPTDLAHGCIEEGGAAAHLKPDQYQLRLLKFNINTYSEQAVITICGFFTITTITVLTVFIQLFGAVIIMYGLFAKI